jgi:hypothetical protein
MSIIGSNAAARKRSQMPVKNPERDTEIHRQVCIEGMRIIDVARYHKLSPTRIQQISRRIQRFLEWSAKNEDEELINNLKRDMDSKK